MNRQRVFLTSCISFGVLSQANTACTTTTTHALPKDWLEYAINGLKEGCHLTPTSGFIADLGIMNQGGARIEAIWNHEGHLEGQILNAIGEDILTFNIDRSGSLRIDKDVKKTDSVVQALDFIAHLGSQETRSLFCSGLFADPKANFLATAYDNIAKKEFVSVSGAAVWYTLSKILPHQKDESQIIVNTKVSSKSFFFKKTVAGITWRGLRKGKKYMPTSLLITVNNLDAKLSFLDFE